MIRIDHKPEIKLAYVHSMTYPSVEANALQAIKMASAFSTLVDTTFIMPGLKTSKLVLQHQYDLPDSPLKIRSLYLERFPNMLRSNYDKFISLYIRFHPSWVMFKGQKILYVRDPRELNFWGLQREHQAWLRDWIFIFEAHDVVGLDPSQFQGSNPFDLINGIEGQRRQELLRALLNFDLVVCVTQALADDLNSWSNNKIRTQVVRHASSLQRVPRPPQIRSFDHKIVLGYIGTIDQYRGVNLLLDAMRLLPQNYSLRLVGRFRQEKGVDPNWLNKYMEDPQISTRVDVIGAVPTREVAAEIDRCDIVLQPASSDLIDARYASPMKSYDYMVRGKPIVAADVPGHHELFRDGENAILYRLEPECLAESIKRLVNHPDLAEKIATAGWEQSIEYTYQRRAAKILSFVLSVAKIG